MESILYVAIVVLATVVDCSNTAEEKRQEGHAVELAANCRPYAESFLKYIKASSIQCQHACFRDGHCEVFAVKKFSKSQFECRVYETFPERCQPSPGWTIYNQIKLQDGYKKKKPVKRRNGNKKFVINANSLSDYVIFPLGTTSDFSEFTICLSVKTEKDRGAFFSYSSSGSPCDEILITNREVKVKGHKMDVHTIIGLSVKQDLCVTWKRQTRKLKIYKDGNFQKCRNLPPHTSIAGGGVVILGQAHRHGNGRNKCSNFDGAKKFIGEISMLRMWSRELDSGEILSIAREQPTIQPDVFTWILFYRNAKSSGNIERVG